MDWPAVWLTIKLALATTGILLMAGIPIAYTLATGRWRGRNIVEALIALPMVLPPTVLGFYILSICGPLSPVNIWLEKSLGVSWKLPNIMFSFTGVLVGSLLCNIPFALRPFIAAFGGIDRKLVEASWSLGISKAATFRKVILPLAWPGIVTGIVLTFAHTVGEFGVIYMVGGNIPGVTRTMSIVIYDHMQALEYGQANQTALAMLGFSFGVLLVTYSLQSRRPQF